MKKLCTVLENIDNTLKPTTPPTNSSDMRQHGLTKPVGRTNTETESQEPSRTPSAKCSTTRTLGTSSEAKARFAKMFYVAHAAYPSYNRPTEEIKDRLRAFVMVLADYTAEQVEGAFLRWLKHYDRFPVPSDIVGLIERNGRPPFERTVYMRLKERQKDSYDFLTEDELNYIKDFEFWCLNGDYRKI